MVSVDTTIRVGDQEKYLKKIIFSATYNNYVFFDPAGLIPFCVSNPPCSSKSSCLQNHLSIRSDIPSLCFALATGVGKTRLMGAFIAYLYLAKGIRNFFVLSPNLTIYNKLITDLSEPNHPKYVFTGIGEFVHHRPRIITGDNYKDFWQSLMFDKSEINISLFNISKINAETRSGAVPRIKRMCEVLDAPYFEYLSNLDDLVLLMDESHHYRADRGMQVINELRPVLGLELTATPQVERGGNSIKFKNVVYEYSLAKAIQDGFVKEPAVATRRDFIPAQYSAEDVDRIKLEDGIRLLPPTSSIFTGNTIPGNTVRILWRKPRAPFT